MRIAVVGVGHVGLVSAAAFGRWGHDVVGLDDDAAKVATLREGRAWFYEPGLQELLDEVIAAGRLTFTSDPGEAIAGAEVVFACVGTPALPDGSPNLAYLEAVAHTVAEVATGDVLLVEKTTVPAGTGRRRAQVGAAGERAGDLGVGSGDGEQRVGVRSAIRHGRPSGISRRRSVQRRIARIRVGHEASRRCPCSR